MCFTRKGGIVWTNYVKLDIVANSITELSILLLKEVTREGILNHQFINEHGMVS